MRTEKINWNNWNWNAYTSLKGIINKLRKTDKDNKK